MLEMVTPIIANSTKHSKNEVGMAKPTSKAARLPRLARITIITSAIAVKTEPSSCPTIEATVSLWSFELPTWMAARRSSGHSA